MSKLKIKGQGGPSGGLREPMALEHGDQQEYKPQGKAAEYHAEGDTRAVMI
jgi:hypothetical protein